MPIYRLAYQGKGLNNRPAAYANGGIVSLTSTSATLATALDAAGQPFMLGVVFSAMHRPVQQIIQFYSGTSTNTAYIGFQSTSSLVRLVFNSSAILSETGTPPAISTNQAILLTYDGTTLSWRRNGVAAGSMSWAKPAAATASTAFRTGTNFKGRYGEIVVQTGTWTTAQRDGLEGFLRQAAGT